MKKMEHFFRRVDKSFENAVPEQWEVIERRAVVPQVSPARRLCGRYFALVASVAVCVAVAVTMLALRKSHIPAVPPEDAVFGTTNVVATTTAEPNVQKTKEMTRDLTLSVDENFPAPDSGKKVMDVRSSMDGFLSPELDSLIQVSDAIVRGTVKNVVFTQFDGIAWTKADLLITESLKGEFQKGDLVSVFILGGYIPLADHIKAYDNAFRYEGLTPEEIQNTVLKETVNGESFAQVGDDYIYCLVKTSKDSPLPDGAYERVSSYGQFAIDQEGDYIQNGVGEDGTAAITPEDFKSHIK